MNLSTNYSSDYVSNSPVKGIGTLFNWGVQGITLGVCMKMIEQAQRENQFMAPDTCTDWMLCLNYSLQIRVRAWMLCLNYSLQIRVRASEI